jgi:hypothetical protein
LESGEEDFNKMKGGFFIYITPYDQFGCGAYRYSFQMNCPDYGINLGDEATRIFLNTRGSNPEDVSPELVELLHYIEHTPKEYDYQSPRVCEILERVNRIKEEHDVQRRYTDYEKQQMLEDTVLEAKEGWKAEGKVEGGILKMIYLICKKLKRGMDIDLIADALEENIEFIQRICDVAKTYQPEYDAELVSKAWLNNIKQQ